MKVAVLFAIAVVASHAEARTIVEGPKFALVGAIKDDRINEASGIVASRAHEGVYWTHNDGDDGVLHAIRRDGTEIASASIDAKVRDWEDIAIDDADNLYVADVGNNSENRKHVVIYRVREPDPAKLKANTQEKLAVDVMWKVNFPDEPANVESLIIRDGFGYLIFKRPEGLPAEVYRFDLKDQKNARMTKVATLPLSQPVTSASLSVDGKHLAVLTRGHLWVFDIGGDFANAEDADATRFAIPPVQVEGCTFGKDEILVVAESREIFATPFKPASTQPAK